MATRNITAAAIAALTYNPHGADRQVLWDKKVTGLGVRVMPSGRKAYVLLFRIFGRSRLMHLGRVDDFQNVGQARDTAAEHLRRLRRDKVDPLAERRREQAAGTIKQMLEQWLAHVGKRRSPRTVADYKSYVTRYLNPEIGTRRPVDFTKGDAQRLHSRLTDRSGPVTANRVVQALRAAYGWALRSDSDTLRPDFLNPVQVEFNRERSRSEFIRPNELPAVTSALEAEPDPWARGFLWLLLLTGARGGELISLRWDDVSLETGELLLRQTKNHSDFNMRLSGAAVDVFRKIPRTPSPYVFPAQRADNESGYMARPRNAWEKVLERAGIKRQITLHDVRRSAGVLLSSRGFTAEQIARQLNHQSNVTAKTYVRIADDLQQKMADTLGTAAGGAGAAQAEVIPLRPPAQRRRRSGSLAQA